MGRGGEVMLAKAHLLVGGVAMLSVSQLSFCQGQPGPYQDRANAAAWGWSADAASLKVCADALPKPWRVEAKFDEWRRGVITISKDGQVLHTWPGHEESVFLLLGDVLYYTAHHPIASGCTLHALSLQTGEALWATHLKGLGPVDHSKYRNQVNLGVEDMQTLRVFGLESYGGYVEYLDRRTGKTVGHRLFPNEEARGRR